jgi:hypothetical protein
MAYSGTALLYFKETGHCYFMTLPRRHHILSTLRNSVTADTGTFAVWLGSYMPLKLERLFRKILYIVVVDMNTTNPCITLRDVIFMRLHFLKYE